ncbi:MAG: enoyl-CoA hydratase/isomerase family protein, partial [bacterium]
GDLNRMFEMLSSGHEIDREMQAGNAVLQCLIDSDLPMIAAIQGVCFGGGLEFALACHIRVAAENALFAFPETNHGLMPGLGGTVRLPALIGKAKAASMILSGDVVNSEEALKLNLIDYLVPRSEAFSFAFNMLQKMTRDLRVDVIRSVIKALHNTSILPEQEAIREETRLFCNLAIQEAQRRFNETT